MLPSLSAGPRSWALAGHPPQIAARLQYAAEVYTRSTCCCQAWVYFKLALADYHEKHIYNFVV